MKDIKQYHTIRKATPEEVFNALTNPFTLELWTGYPAKMELKKGGEFSLWEGDIVGKILDFETPKRIVQEWYFEGYEDQSVVTIDLFPDKKGTKVRLEHTNIPDEAYENMEEGWKKFYFENLKRFFNL